MCLDNWDLSTVIIVEIWGTTFFLQLLPRNRSVPQFHLVGLFPPIDFVAFGHVISAFKNAIARLWSQRTTSYRRRATYSWSMLNFGSCKITPKGICVSHALELHWNLHCPELKCQVHLLIYWTNKTACNKVCNQLAVSNTCEMIFLDINTAVYGGNIHWKKTGQWVTREPKILEAQWLD